MEEIIKYENRQNLYQFLIDGYGFKVKEEKYYPKEFGNFNINLCGDIFSLRYYNDRNFLSIEVASNNNEDKWYALSFIMDLIYNPDVINGQKEKKDNATRINELNNFLRKDFDKICELLNKENYINTQKGLDQGLDKQFLLKYPSIKG